MRLSQLERWLDGLGWRLDRIRGSHYHWKHPATGERLTVAVHGTEITPYWQRRILRDLEQTRAPMA